MRKKDRINLGSGALVLLASACAAVAFQSVWVGVIVFVVIAAVFSSKRIFR